MKKLNSQILFLLLAGCMKTPELNTNFGPEVTADQLNQALGQAQDQSSITTVQNIKKGEFAYFEKTNQIETSYPEVIRQRAETVTDESQDSSRAIYTITEQLNELNESTGNMQASQSQSSACLERAIGGCEQSASASAIAQLFIPSFSRGLKALTSIGDTPPPSYGASFTPFRDLSWKAIVQQAKDNSTSEIKWTYHNLVVTHSTTPVPPLVALRSNCGGRTSPCGSPMNTILVSFDEVDWSSEKYPVKYSYNLVFSAEAPFFASQLQSCASTTIPYQDQRFAVLQCEYVKDFTVGHD